jgi:hypothetical protein
MPGTPPLVKEEKTTATKLETNAEPLGFFIDVKRENTEDTMATPVEPCVDDGYEAAEEDFDALPEADDKQLEDLVGFVAEQAASSGRGDAVRHLVLTIR